MNTNSILGLSLKVALASAVAVVPFQLEPSAIAFCSPAMVLPHVIIPTGTPKGNGTRNGRAFRATIGSQDLTLWGAVGATTADDSMHFLVCFDEGLPTEKQYVEHSTRVNNGVTEAQSGFKIPAGVTTAHWVILFDKEGAFTWGADGTINL